MRLFDDPALYPPAPQPEEAVEPPPPLAPITDEEAQTEIHPAEKYLQAMNALPDYLRPGAKIRGAGPDEMAGIKPKATLAHFDAGATQPATDKATPAERPALPSHTAKPTVIFIGGFLDGTTNAVNRYYQRYKKDHPDVDTEYFPHDAEAAIRNYINGLKADAPVTLVGHSWGGDTAMEVARDLPKGRLETLITIDPVGAGGANFLDSVADHARRWIDVSSEGGGFFNLSNLVARELPAIYGGAASGDGIEKYTKEFIKSKHSHRDFEEMLLEKDPVTGHAVEDALPGPK